MTSILDDYTTWFFKRLFNDNSEFFDDPRIGLFDKEEKKENSRKSVIKKKDDDINSKAELYI